MKILKLLEQVQADYRKRQSNNVFNQERGDRLRDKHDGSDKSGYAGRVYAAGDPHTLYKTNFNAEKDTVDGYMVYMKHLIDTELYNSNPFAPRVYKMDVVEDKTGKSKYKIELETLQRIDSVDQKLVISALVNLYDIESVEYAAEMIPFAINDPIRLLAKCIDLTAQQKLESKNGMLNSLCDTIHNLNKKYRLEIDIHGNNIMLRLGKSPQVVIVDPLS